MHTEDEMHLLQLVIFPPDALHKIHYFIEVLNQIEGSNNRNTLQLKNINKYLKTI